MRRLSLFAALCMILCLCLPVSAQNSSFDVGEVLYHQDFSVVTNIADSGVRVGSLTAPNCWISTAGDTLDIMTNYNGRVYAILPSFTKSDTYTVEFSFNFSEIGAENGYLAFILTCRGEEPTNISSVVIRADGTVDEFDDPDSVIADAVSNGETVNVKIPVSGGAVYQILLSNGENECVIERDSVLVIGDGDIGFAARNASASVNEIYVVNGIDYDGFSGYYADESYATDLSPAPDNDAETTSPATSDAAVLAVIGTVSSLAAMSLKKRR